MAKGKGKGKSKIGTVLGEFKRGTLRMGKTGKKVPKGRPDIAKAIALSEARRAGAQIPGPRTRRVRSA